MYTTSNIPSHVPPERIFSFDFMRDPRFDVLGDVWEGVEALRNEGAPGMFWSPELGGHWVIQDHELLFEAVRDTEIFSSNNARIWPIIDPGEPQTMAIPISLDPPMHGAYRLPLQVALAPKPIQALEGEIRSLAGELIDAIAPRGECDFFKAVAELLPVTIFMRLLGLPVERLRDFRALVSRWGKRNDPAEFAATKDEILAEVDALIVDHRATPRNDLLGRLLTSLEVDGRPTTNEEIRAYTLLLIVAGLDTVANAIAFGVRYLARNPDIQARLRASPELIPTAVEELLRRHSVVQPSRRVTRDVEWNGISLRKDERVLLLLAGANTDPKSFDRPGEVNLDRDPKPHIVFNAGPHRCIGSHLARLELRVLYEELLKRLPTFKLDPTRSGNMHGTSVFGVDSLPLVWDVA